MRTRFAPSPTGFLHIGGLRTALYAYLLAKQQQGVFYVRIEDTDQERLVEGAVESLLKSLAWAGLTPDEGYQLINNHLTEVGAFGPYTQSQRLPMYQKYAQQLLDRQLAYYAFDTKDEIDRMRDEGLKAGNPAPKYDWSVRQRMVNSFTLSPAQVAERLASGDPYVVRYAVPESQTITFTDAVRGAVEWKGREIDDKVLLKSDGFPTYHLAHVVDDYLMQTSLVIRGEEWLSSLPFHLLLWQAFGWQPPQYAHLSLILNADKTKLSKRQNDVAVEDYINKGYLPEALLNFVAFLGWNPGTTQELFTLPEMIEQFSLERVQKAGAVFDPQKLDWLQGQWIRKLSLTEFSERILPIVATVYPTALNDPDFKNKANLIHERITFFAEAPAMLQFFYTEPVVDLQLICSDKQGVSTSNLPQIITLLKQTLATLAVQDWHDEKLKEVLFNLAETSGLKRGQILWPLRAILTGLPFSPGAFEVAALLGQQTTLHRLELVQI